MGTLAYDAAGVAALNILLEPSVASAATGSTAQGSTAEVATLAYDDDWALGTNWQHGPGNASSSYSGVAAAVRNATDLQAETLEYSAAGQGDEGTLFYEEEFTPLQSGLASSAATAPLDTVSAASAAAATTTDTTTVEATIPYGEDTCQSWPIAEATAAATPAVSRAACDQSGNGIRGTDVVPATTDEVLGHATSADTSRTSTQQPSESSMAAMPPPLPPTRVATVEPQQARIGQVRAAPEQRPFDPPAPTAAQAAVQPAATVTSSGSSSTHRNTAARAAATAAPVRRRLIGKQPVAQRHACSRAANTGGGRGQPPVPPPPAATAAPTVARVTKRLAAASSIKVGSKVKVQGDGWGGGSGEYVASVTEADEMTLTLVFKKGAAWEETCVLREHCTLLQQEERSAGKRART